MLKLGCPKKFVRSIQFLHDEMKASVGFNEALSDEQPIDNGVKQGDISAPTLFTIYFKEVFLVGLSMKIQTVSTSDIECLVKYT